MNRLVRGVVALLAALLVVPLMETQPAAAATLPPPTMLTPTPGGTVQGNPIFTWTPVTGAVRYQFQLASSSTFEIGTKFYDVYTYNTSATPPLDLPLQTMYWRVRSVDINGTAGDWPIQPSTFTKQANPSVTLTAPPDGANFDFPTQPVVFSWAPMSGAKSYALEIDDDPQFTPPLAVPTIGTNNTTYALTSPQNINQTYYWRVRSFTLSDRASDYSEVRSYTTSWSSVPQLTFPPDTNATPIEEVVLQWDPVPGAVTYDLQVSPDFFFNTNVHAQNVKSTRYSPTTTFDNASYFWRVRARNANNGVGNWSSIRTFTRAWPANPGLGQTPTPQWSNSTAITLLTPANNTVATTLPTFSWTPMRLASSYEIQMSVDQFFSPGTIVGCTTNHTTFTPYAGCGVDPGPGTTYYWKVRALDAPGNINGLWSPTFSFSYVPTAVVPVSPANGAATSLPILRWQVPSDSIARYRVVITGPSNITIDTYNNYFVPQNLAVPGAYTWYVRTIDRLGRVGPIPGWSRTFNLQAPTTTVTPPTVIPLNVPVTTDGYHAPLLSWTPVVGANRYEVWVRKAGDLVFFKVNSGTITLPGYAHTLDDLEPQTYEYFIDALDQNGASLTSSNIGTFTISALPATVLTGPAHCTPNTACASEPDTPTFTWTRVPGATKYLVTLAADANFTNVTTSYETQYPQLTPRESLKDSQAGQATYWYARPCYGNRCGPGPDFFAGTSPPIRAFRKQSYPVEPFFPANGATVNDQITFAWKDYLLSNQVPAGVGQAPSTQEARAYRLRVSTTADFSQLIDNVVVDQTTYTPYSKTYPIGPLYWRVNAIDGSGNELTESDPAPSTPRVVYKAAPSLTLTAPLPGEQVEGVPMFSWTPQAYAKHYEIEIYKNPDQPLAVVNRVHNQGSLGQASYAPVGALAAGTYGWRMRRNDADGRTGPWTATDNTQLRLFTLGGQPTTLLSPIGGVNVGYNQLVFQWTPVDRATQYKVEVSIDPAFTSFVESPPINTPLTAWAPIIKYGDGTYYWRVKTLDAAGNPQATSPVETFVVVSLGGAFHPVTPYRALDSRTSIGGFNGPLVGGQVKSLLVADGNTIPTSASAVVMNVTATGGTQSSFLSLYPAGAPNPGTASLLFAAGQSVPNLVTVKLGAGGGNTGRVTFYNQQGSVHVIADIVGYYDSGSDPNGSYFNGITPQRLLDSRNNTGGWGATKLGAGQSRNLQVGGVVPIPGNATGVVMNVTVAGGTSSSYLSVYPAGAANPGTANLLFAANQAVPNLVVVGLGSGGANAGKVTFFNQQGAVDVIADVVGYFDPNTGDRFHPITPVRALDSRSGVNIGLTGPWSTNLSRTLPVGGSTPGVPNTAKGIVANLTATGGTLPSYVGLYPTGSPNPGTANLLFAAGQTIPNAVYVKTGTGGGVDIYNQQGVVNLIMDVAGYFAAF